MAYIAENAAFSSLNDVITLSRPEAAALSVIDKWLDYRARCKAVPGYQVCIKKYGIPILSAAYGEADIDKGQPMSKGDLIWLGSQTKSLTACITLQLIEKGLIEFETPVATIVPELKQHPDPLFASITIKSLVMHRAGFARDYADTIFDETFSSDNPDKDYDHLIRHILSSSLVYAPNTVTKYSNLAFALLGCALERATGLAYSDLVETYINKAIGTRFITSSDPAYTTVVPGYSGVLGNGKRCKLPCAPLKAAIGAAGLYATTADTSTFFHEYLYGTRLIGQSMQQKLHEDAHAVINFHASRYGYGIIHGRASGTAYIGHVGESPGFASQTFAIDDGKYLISIAMNSGEVLIRDIFPNITGILLHMNKIFGPHEDITVAGPMVDRRAAFVVVAGATKALYIPLDNWTPHRLATELEVTADGSYVSLEQDGYWNVAEPLRLVKNAQGQTTIVQWGAMATRDEGTFLARNAEQVAP